MDPTWPPSASRLPRSNSTGRRGQAAGAYPMPQFLPLDAFVKVHQRIVIVMAEPLARSFLIEACQMSQARWQH